MEKLSIQDLAACVRFTEVCPECGDDLDTGYGCNACGYDAYPLIVLAEAPVGRH